MTQLPSNSLSVTAETVRTILLEADALASRSIDKMLEAGGLLVEAKAQCKHGEWLPFLERAGIKKRRAQQYMQLAQSGLKSATIAQFGGVNGALEFLGRRKLPEQGACLEIIARKSDNISAIGAVWPSVDHAGFYYCAVTDFTDDADTVPSAGIWTKRPLSGSPIFLGDGEGAYEPVWGFLERYMASPQSAWEFSDESRLPSVLAYIMDLPYLVSEAESKKPWRDADSASVADLLASVGVVPPYPEAQAA